MGTIGENVKRLREAGHYTQKGLGDIVGVTESHIGYIEHGARIPSAKLVKRLAEAFGVDEATVRYGKGETPNEVLGDSLWDRMMFEVWAKLPEAKKQKIFTLAAAEIPVGEQNGDQGPPRVEKP